MSGNNLKDLKQVLEQIEGKVKENRNKYDDSNKATKNFRKIFDQDSSLMNAAIFNDAPPDEIHKETLRTVSSLIEILSRIGK